jgi:A/G-specific adenine glycosylase
VDGNVFRVLSRVFGIDDEINSPQGKKTFTALANTLISKNFPDFHNQAVMEFGALHCVPQNPNCLNCCLKSSCFAAKHDLQHAFPQKLKAKAARKRYFYYVVIRSGKTLAMKNRGGKDIWQGLYDFHLIEKNRPTNKENLSAEITQSFKHRLTIKALDWVGGYKHILTHQIIHAKFIIVNSAHPVIDKSLKFYTLEKIADLPKPTLISRFLTEYKNFYS